MRKQQTAKLNYLHMAPRKVRFVAATLKGLSAQDAEAQLLLRNRRPAKPLLKLLRSAIANAKQQKLALERLYISSIRVDQGPMLKRSLPRAQGRATPIQKKMSHIQLVLTEGDKIFPVRYTIATAKKEKKSVKKKGKSSAPKTELKEAKPKVERKPSFFQKVFRRKSV